MIPSSSQILAMYIAICGAVFRSTLIPWVPCPNLSAFGSSVSGKPWHRLGVEHTIALFSIPILISLFSFWKSIPESSIPILTRRSSCLRFSSSTSCTNFSWANHSSAHLALPISSKSKEHFTCHLSPDGSTSWKHCQSVEEFRPWKLEFRKMKAVFFKCRLNLMYYRPCPTATNQ